MRLKPSAHIAEGPGRAARCVPGAMRAAGRTPPAKRTPPFGPDMLAREGHVGQNVVLAFLHETGESGPAGPELIRHAPPCLASGLEVRVIDASAGCALPESGVCNFPGWER